MLSTRLLVVHRTVVEEGSLTQAAAVLGYTVSAVSQQLAQLEAQAGSVLFEKAGRGVRPTAAGQLLAEHAGRVLHEIEEAENALADLRDGRVGRIRVVAFPSAGESLLPEAIATLREVMPGVHGAAQRGRDPGGPAPPARRRGRAGGRRRAVRPRLPAGRRPAPLAPPRRRVPAAAAQHPPAGPPPRRRARGPLRVRLDRHDRPGRLRAPDHGRDLPAGGVHPEGDRRVRRVPRHPGLRGRGHGRVVGASAGAGRPAPRGRRPPAGTGPGAAAHLAGHPPGPAWAADGAADGRALRLAAANANKH